MMFDHTRWLRCRKVVLILWTGYQSCNSERSQVSVEERSRYKSVHSDMIPFSIFDGIIIMDKSPVQANLPTRPGKRRYDWAEVTWNQWRSLHELPKQSSTGGLSLSAYQAFPNEMPSGISGNKDEQEGFQQHCISGRPPSELRAPLELYQQLSDDNT